jgi:hypothetical protein
MVLQDRTMMSDYEQIDKSWEERMGTKIEAIENGYQLPDGTLEPTDVLVDIDFNSKGRGGPVKGGEPAQSHFARRLRALHAPVCGHASGSDH